ncbi:uncharacterized protein LOC143250364 [Tachypleus tridentatus]|uniref:uncharacterized protein LOC143250364 n=1 Tax=Tachypleus tridentatus TaxID=6853 RepID=UPI003FD4E630
MIPQKIFALFSLSLLMLTVWAEENNQVAETEDLKAEATGYGGYAGGFGGGSYGGGAVTLLAIPITVVPARVVGVGGYGDFGRIDGFGGGIGGFGRGYYGGKIYYKRW